MNLRSALLNVAKIIVLVCLLARMSEPAIVSTVSVRHNMIVNVLSIGHEKQIDGDPYYLLEILATKDDISRNFVVDKCKFTVVCRSETIQQEFHWVRETRTAHCYAPLSQFVACGKTQSESPSQFTIVAGVDCELTGDHYTFPVHISRKLHEDHRTYQVVEYGWTNDKDGELNVLIKGCTCEKNDSMIEGIVPVSEERCDKKFGSVRCCRLLSTNVAPETSSSIPLGKRNGCFRGRREIVTDANRGSRLIVEVDLCSSDESDMESEEIDAGEWTVKRSLSSSSLSPAKSIEAFYYDKERGVFSALDSVELKVGDWVYGIMRNVRRSLLLVYVCRLGHYSRADGNCDHPHEKPDHHHSGHLDSSSPHIRYLYSNNKNNEDGDDDDSVHRVDTLWNFTLSDRPDVIHEKIAKMAEGGADDISYFKYILAEGVPSGSGDRYKIVTEMRADDRNESEKRRRRMTMVRRRTRLYGDSDTNTVGSPPPLPSAPYHTVRVTCPDNMIINNGVCRLGMSGDVSSHSHQELTVSDRVRGVFVIAVLVSILCFLMFAMLITRFDKYQRQGNMSASAPWNK